MPEKIRPASHSSFKAADEAELPDVAKAPDIGARGGADEDSVSASVNPADPLGVFQNATLSPTEAAEFRRTMNDPNRLGNPRSDTEAERALKDYEAKKAAYKADYSGTRSERLKVPFLEAKQRMIDLGLIKGEV